MAKIYANLIKNGIKTIEDVPLALREAVQILLNKSVIENHKLK